MFKNVLLIGKPLGALPEANENTRLVLQDVRKALSGVGCSVLMQDIAEIKSGQIDLAVVVGGDGTMLAAARQLATLDVPMIGINQGRLGFITDIALDNFAQTLAPMLRGEFVAETRSLLHAQVIRGNQCVHDAIAMNDVVINRGASSGMVELRIKVDGKFVADQRADGLIISTPTGSTAYALSSGGSLLHPTLAGWNLVPIAPHRLSNRPIVLPESCSIDIEVISEREATANFDMQTMADLMHGDRITVARAAHAAKFLHPKGWNYFDTLRQKLHWNEG
jgi:NAD+ kinase